MILTPTRTLAALNVLAIAGVAALWIDPQGQLRNSQWVAPVAIQPELAAGLKVENAQFSSDASFYTATLERPLFSPDRRAAPPPPVAQAEVISDAFSGARLFGLITGEQPIAMMRSDGKIRSIRLNESLGDWVLTAIEDREATFTRGPDTRVLKLEYASLSVTEGASSRTGAVPGLGGMTIEQLGAKQAELIKQQNDEQADREARVAAMRAKMSQSNTKKP